MAGRRPEQSLADSYADQLRSVGRLDTPDAKLLLLLATSLEFEAHSGGAQAALAIRITKVADRAFAGCDIQSDALDDLTAKRRTRFVSGAGA
jgi:hypothetical protein